MNSYHSFLDYKVALYDKAFDALDTRMIEELVPWQQELWEKNIQCLTLRKLGQMYILVPRPRTGSPQGVDGDPGHIGETMQPNTGALQAT